jgi:hypothetical protein
VCEEALHDLFKECAIARDAKNAPSEEVTKLLENDLLIDDSSLGFRF